MSLSGSILTIFEMALVAFAIWSVFNEKRFIAFEERILSKIRRNRLKVIKGNSVCKTYYPEKHHA